MKKKKGKTKGTVSKAIRQKGTKTGDKKQGGGTHEPMTRILNRAVEAYRLWATGVTQIEIAKKLKVSTKTVRADLKRVVDIENPEHIKGKIESVYTEVIRKANDYLRKEEGAGGQGSNRIGLLNAIREASTRLAKLHGLETEPSFMQSISVGAAGGENEYDRWGGDRLRKEFERRRPEVHGGNGQGGNE